MHDIYKTVKNNKTTFWYVGKKTCDVCEKDFYRNTAFCIYNWNPKESSRSIVCYNCVSERKLPVITYSQDRFVVYCVDDEPIGSIPIFPQPPVLKVNRRDQTVFEGNKVISDKTTNNCVHANSFFGDEKEHGFMIGKSVDDLLLTKDKLLDYNTAIVLLENIKREV